MCELVLDVCDDYVFGWCGVVVVVMDFDWIDDLYVWVLFGCVCFDGYV